MCVVAGLTLIGKGVATAVSTLGSAVGIGGGSAATAGASAATGLTTSQALTLGATGLSAASGVASTAYSVAAGRRNAEIAEAQARQQERQAELDIVRQQQQRAQAVGGLAAGFGASGVDLGTGSPLQVLRAEIEQGQLDSEIIRFNSQNTSNNLQFEAAQRRQQSRFDIAGGAFDTAGTLLSGASQSRLFGGP